MNKIKIVWIVNDLYINNFISVYKEIMKNNNIFDIKVIATTHVNHDDLRSISSLTIHKFLNENNINNIDCYDKDHNLFDIKSLNPDYVFYLTPYNYYLPDEYNSSIVSKYAKVCAINYGADMIQYSGMYSVMIENNFWKDCYRFFCESKYFNKFEGITEKTIPVGYLKLDEYLYYDKKNFLSNNGDKKDRKKVIWKPRWTLDADSSFVSYIDKMISYMETNSKTDFVIYLHPLINYKIRKIGYEKNLNIQKKKINKLKNVKIIEDHNFLDEILTGDIYISEHSSTLVEFTITGNPIIYCDGPVKLNDLGKKIIENSYVSKNIDETLILLDSLINNNDYKKEKREKEKNSYFFVPPLNYSSAQYLLLLLLEDYINNEGFNQELRNNYYIEKEKLKKENSIKSNEIIKKDKIIDELNTTIKNLYTSNSWKITSIFRYFKKIIRRIND